jgi:hypothetical protein
MATTSEARALPFFTDLQGLPLESGSIFIGQPGLDPQAYPQTVYSDAASTIALQQPIRTTHGRAVSGGAQVHLFCRVPYSIVVLDAQGRTVYASLNEIDPIFTALSTSSIQSAADLPTLRARSGPSTNLVWVAGFGMYRFISSDSTSPENIPFVIVGTDGSRYYLDLHTANLAVAKISANEPTANYNSQGMWVSWNDLGNGAGFITNNQGGGTGGLVIRNVNASSTAETGRVTIGGDGSITASSTVTTTSGDVKAAGNLIASGGIVAVTADGSRSLLWNAGSARYELNSAPLTINGSTALTQANYQASILANQQANGVGAVALGSSSGVNPPTLPGTWVQTGSNFNTVFQYVRVV